MAGALFQDGSWSRHMAAGSAGPLLGSGARAGRSAEVDKVGGRREPG
jgi:hypothetical protein